MWKPPEGRRLVGKAQVFDAARLEAYAVVGLVAFGVARRVVDLHLVETGLSVLVVRHMVAPQVTFSRGAECLGANVQAPPHPGAGTR